MVREATAAPRRKAESLILSGGAYLAIAVVTVFATFMTAAQGLGDEYRPPEQRVRTTIMIAVLAAAVVAAIAAGTLRHTRRLSRSRLWHPPLVVCTGLVVAVLLLAHRGTSEAVHSWSHPTAGGYAGDRWWALAALVASACPFLTVAATAFRTGAARVFILAAGAASLAWLAADAFDHVSRATL
jgi:xanthine/uracil permease